MYAIIKRGDGKFFDGDVDGAGRPYEMRGPYSTLADVLERRRIITADDEPRWPHGDSAELQDFDAAHPDATLWSDSNGDEEAIDSWTWEVVHE